MQLGTAHWENPHSPTTQIASSKTRKEPTKTKEDNPQTRTKGMGTPYTLSVVFSVVGAFAGWRLFVAEPRIFEVRIDSTPTSRFLHRQVGLCPRDNGRALRSAVSSMSQRLATFQLRKSVHSELGLPFTGWRRQSQGPHRRSYGGRSRTHRHRGCRGARGRGSSRRSRSCIG